MIKRKANYHSRAVRHPPFSDYQEMGSEFRPFTSFVHQCGYRSPSVNTDWLGLREQYDAEGNFLDLLDPPSVGPECDILLGGSVAFGVPVSSDRDTISTHLSRTGRSCVNLGICGATGQQELAIFLVMRPRLPKVRDVILLSGFNECMLAAGERTVVFAEYGGMFMDKARLSGLDGRALADPSRYRAQQRAGAFAEGAYTVFAKLRRFLQPRAGGSLYPNFDEKLVSLLGHLIAVLDVWAALQEAWGMKVHYVLQPVFSWGPRRPTPREQHLVASERTEIPETVRIEQPDVYPRVRGAIATACERRGIAFHDSNEWIAGPRFRNQEVFVDHCHLTDAASKLMAETMRAELSLRSCER